MLKYKLLPFLVATAFGSFTVVHEAGAVPGQSASDSGTLGGAGFTVTSATSGVPGTVDILTFPSSGTNTGFFHVYGSVSETSVYFGSRTSGTGVYDLSGPYHMQQDFTLAAPAPGKFSFTVDNGELSVHCSPCTGGGSAMYTIDIKIDGTSVAGGTGTGLLTVAGDGSTLLTHSGLALTGLAASGTTGSASVDYGWSATSFSLPLGMLSAGLHTLSYDLITKATGNFTNDQVCGGYGGGNGIKLENPEGGGSCGLGNTTARSGDPFVFPTDAPNPGDVGLQVPEPGTLALLGIGLAAAAGLRRRRGRGNNSGD